MQTFLLRLCNGRGGANRRTRRGPEHFDVYLLWKIHNEQWVSGGHHPSDSQVHPAVSVQVTLTLPCCMF